MAPRSRMARHRGGLAALETDSARLPGGAAACLPITQALVRLAVDWRRALGNAGPRSWCRRATLEVEDGSSRSLEVSLLRAAHPRRWGPLASRQCRTSRDTPPGRMVYEIAASLHAALGVLARPVDATGPSGLHGLSTSLASFRLKWMPRPGGFSRGSPSFSPGAPRHTTRAAKA